MGQNRKRFESQKIVDEIKKTAEARNVDPVKLIGSILHRSDTLTVLRLLL